MHLGVNAAMHIFFGAGQDALSPRFDARFERAANKSAIVLIADLQIQRRKRFTP
jgi:hypothetical protein